MLCSVLNKTLKTMQFGKHSCELFQRGVKVKYVKDIGLMRNILNAHFMILGMLNTLNKSFLKNCKQICDAM